jgi:hypothetical protein
MIFVFKMSNYPAFLCQLCSKDLENASKFRKKCIESEKIFQSELINKLKDEKSFETVEVEFNDSRDTNPMEKVPRRMKSSSHKTVSSSPVQPDSKSSAKETFFCSKCFKSFCDRSYLKKHEYFRHPAFPVAKSFECDICGHKSKSKQLMRSHVNALHSSK